MNYWQCHLHGPCKQVEPCCEKAIPITEEEFKTRMQRYIDRFRRG